MTYEDQKQKVLESFVTNILIVTSDYYNWHVSSVVERDNKLFLLSHTGRDASKVYLLSDHRTDVVLTRNHFVEMFGNDELKTDDVEIKVDWISFEKVAKLQPL